MLPQTNLSAHLTLVSTVQLISGFPSQIMLFMNSTIFLCLLVANMADSSEPSYSSQSETRNCLRIF